MAEHELPIEPGSLEFRPMITSDFDVVKALHEECLPVKCGVICEVLFGPFGLTRPCLADIKIHTFESCLIGVRKRLHWWYHAKNAWLE
jgi:hypothetical protein